MAKTETTVNNLKINRGTYANIQANLSSIGENELIITTDKNMPVPTASDAGKVISVGNDGEYTLQPTSPSGVTSVGIINGGGLTVSGSPITSSGSITVGHATGTGTSTSNTGRTYVQNITLDSYGHITNVTNATETVVDTNTTYSLNVNGTGTNATKLGLTAGGSGSGTTWVTVPYATTAGSADSVAWANVVGHDAGVDADLGIDTSSGDTTKFLNNKGDWAVPSITNNVTGSGTSTHVPRWTGTNTIGDTTVVIDNNNNIVTSKAIVLSGVSSSISSSDSKIYFGSSTSDYYSYLSSNTSGAFSFGASGGGAITVYPNSGSYNCMMTNCGSDLGRSDADGSKAWNNLYLKGGIYKYSGGTHYKQELQNKAGTIALTSDIPSAPGTLNTTATTAQATNASEALSGSITLHKVAKTGTYSDLIGKPTIPTVGTLNTDNSTAQTVSASESLSGTVKLHKVAKTGTYSDLIGTPNLATVATSGSYNDLTNKPTIPTKTSDLTNDGSDGTSTYVESDDLATVATTGSYNDLSNKPTIPTVGALNTNNTTSQTVQSSETFSGNINLHKVSKTGDYGDLLNRPTIPTQTSDLTNDGSDGTSTYVETNEFTAVTASKATAGTAVSCYKSGGVVSQTSYTSGVSFTVAEGTVTATSVYTGGGTVSQTSYSSESITPYTFADVTALNWAS